MKKAGGQEMTCVPTPAVKPKVTLSSKDAAKMLSASTTAAQISSAPITAEFLSEASFADNALF